MRRKIAILIIFIYLFTGTNFIKGINMETVSYWGASGDEVIQIQNKLKQWGYYNGAIDGSYGSKTYQAVKNFQAKNGLTADGVAGMKTLEALGISTKKTTANNNVNLLARAISGEARGESYEGQVAVGAVILNRVNSSKFPNTLAGVIYQSGAFDSVKDGQINMEPTSTALKAAQDALSGWDPTGGCIYFFNPSTSTSKWIWSRPIVRTIGKHCFAK